jgi:hypothetical protein
VSVAPSIIRINGNPIYYSPEIKKIEHSIEEALKVGSEEGMKLLVTRKGKAAIVSLWSFSGVMLAQTEIHAASMKPSMWKEISPVFGVFQEIAMVTGSLAVITGLIIMVFKKSLGWTVITTATCVVLGCFLAPSAVMLVAIVGKLLNGALSNAFEAFQQSGSW